MQRISVFLAMAACALLAQPAPAQPNQPAPPTIEIQSGSYRVDPQHVSVTARVLHQGFSNYTFRFNVVRCDLTIADDPLASSIVARVDPMAVDTGLPAFNSEVARFLGAATTPQVEFRSTRIERVSANSGRVHGNLTMNGQTKPVVLDFRLNKSGANMFGRQTMGFSVTGVIRRSEFGIASGLPLHDVADEVEIAIEVELARAAT